MGRAISKFRQADISRALKAAQSAGFEVGSIEIRPDGVLQISIARRESAQPKRITVQ